MSAVAWIGAGAVGCFVLLLAVIGACAVIGILLGPTEERW